MTLHPYKNWQTCTYTFPSPFLVFNNSILCSFAKLWHLYLKIEKSEVKKEILKAELTAAAWSALTQSLIVSMFGAAKKYFLSAKPISEAIKEDIIFSNKWLFWHAPISQWFVQILAEQPKQF